MLNRILILLGAAILIALTIRFTMADKFKKETAAPEVAVAVAESEADVLRVDPGLPGDVAAIDRKDDGHYWTTADVDGVAVKFMVDTGASIVALTYKDAERLGLKPDNLAFDTEIRTAGGVVHGAYVILPSIRIGSVEIANVDAIVMQEQLDQSLLGMSFLGELYSYEFRRSQLILRQ